MAALAALAVVALVWFQPHKLFLNQEVEESTPGSSSRPAAKDSTSKASDSAGASGKSKVLTAGGFQALAHPASGRAAIIEVPGDATYLRLEDFEVENGPDLRVYLSAATSDSGDAELAGDFIDIGALKGNIGSQNYRLPDGTDTADFRSAVIWCRRFSVGFAVAPLDA